MISRHGIAADVAAALAEDVRDGDVTAELVDSGAHADARVICRELAVLCGQPWFDESLRQVDPTLNTHWLVKEGADVTPDTTVVEISGPARSLLTAERTALNFLQLLSGVATASRRYASAIADTTARVLDTRKTLPGLRLAQKYAVHIGGASNHRIGLFDAYLIKENHIAAAGSIDHAVARARACRPDLLVEVEVENMTQLDEAIAAGADRVMLDNFSIEETHAAVTHVAGRLELEASGNVESLEDLRALAATGVDFISSGALTKHVRAVDFSMRFSP